MAERTRNYEPNGNKMCGLKGGKISCNDMFLPFFFSCPKLSTFDFSIVFRSAILSRSLPLFHLGFLEKKETPHATECLCSTRRPQRQSLPLLSVFFVCEGSNGKVEEWKAFPLCHCCGALGNFPECLLQIEMWFSDFCLLVESACIAGHSNVAAMPKC